MRYRKKRNSPKTKETKDAWQQELLPSQKQNASVLASVEENLAFLDDLLGNAIGLIKKEYYLRDDIKIGLVYIESMANLEFISRQIIEPLLNTEVDSQVQLADIPLIIQSKIIYAPETVTSSQEVKQVTTELLSGNTVLFINGIDAAIIITNQKLEKRALEKPEIEKSFHASLDSFTEDIDTNCSLIIRRLPTPDLRLEEFAVGRLSHTRVKLLWLENISNMQAVTEARQRIQNIDIDMLEGIGGLANLIEDQTWCIFPKYIQSERPDVSVKYLTDGRFIILCGNSPYAFIAPVSLWDHFMTADDYADKTVSISYARILRISAFIISILISPLYLAFVTHHHSIVPPALALNIASGREGVPFPSVVELLLVTAIISIFREAALRIHVTIANFIGVLGAIVIGQAAVTAGYFSASVIIVVAVSAIASFGSSAIILIVPGRLLNYFLILLSGFLGMFGIINGVAVIIWNLLTQKSFGMPYLYPLVPFDRNALKDTLIRAPVRQLEKRTGILAKKNIHRISQQDVK
ncbi:MAG: spore germination protein [Syntrophomonas sp.]|nr:spore germination protein [Syntrophomonas sp.]